MLKRIMLNLMEKQQNKNPLNQQVQNLIAFRAIFCKMIRFAFLSIATCFNNFFLNLQFLLIEMNK